ncbi:MAG: LysR family transcriptional regulator [Oscillospiraceae bacterium]
MDIEYLKEFLAMSRTCNYTEVAEELFISQSSLYKHMKALEAEIGSVLFIKDGRKVKLTRYGRMLVPYAQQVLELQERYFRDVQEARQEDNSILVLGTAYRVTDLVREFRKKYGPHCMVRERKGNEELLKDDTDCELLIACNLNHEKYDYETIPYCEEEMVVVLPLGHPLATKKSLTLAEIQKENFVMVSPFGVGLDMGSSYLRAHNVTPKVVMNGLTGTEVANLVSEGVGISILNRQSIERAMPGAVTFVSLEPKQEFKVELCWRKGQKLSDMALKFIDFVQEYKKIQFEN